MPVLASWPEVVLMTFSTKTDVMNQEELQYIYFFLIFTAYVNSTNGQNLLTGAI